MACKLYHCITPDGYINHYITIRPKTGASYELFAKVGGKSVYASTFVPQEPRIDNAVFHDEYICQ